jgi:hypothetical protein
MVNGGPDLEKDLWEEDYNADIWSQHKHVEGNHSYQVEK